MSGIERIAAERQRQINTEGWTPEHDDGHDSGEMVDAAISYALSPYSDDRIGDDHRIPAGYVVPRFWPWDIEWWKPNPRDRIRELTISGALIAAEIDRLERADTPTTKNQRNNP
jgi:hypothetical protein